MYNYFLKPSSLFNEIGVHLRLGVTQNGVHLNLQWSQIHTERNGPPLKRLKEMCIYIRYSMSIIEKVFHYEENEITVIKCRDDV